MVVDTIYRDDSAIIDSYGRMMCPALAMYYWTIGPRSNWNSGSAGFGPNVRMVVWVGCLVLDSRDTLGSARIWAFYFWTRVVGDRKQPLHVMRPFAHSRRLTIPSIYYAYRSNPLSRCVLYTYIWNKSSLYEWKWTECTEFWGNAYRSGYDDACPKSSAWQRYFTCDYYSNCPENYSMVTCE